MSIYKELFKHLANEHDLIFLESDMQEIIIICEKIKKPIKKQKPIEDRKYEFENKCGKYSDEYYTETLMDFISYWTEANDGAKKMRFEMAKNQPFNIGRRLGTWKKNQKNYGNQKNSGATTDQITGIYANKFGKQG